MSAAAGIVVVGMSAAGTAAAEGLRRGGYDGPLTLISEETRLPYERPPLSKAVLAGDGPPDSEAGGDPGHLEQRLSLDVRLGVRATALDVPARRLTLGTGEELDCTAVVVATGVRPRRLPGTEGVAGVHVLRTLDDALALRKDLVAGGPVAVVGGGVLGTEVAAAARGLGLDVTLITVDDQPMAPVLGGSLGLLIAHEHRRHGVRVRTGRTVTGLLTAGGRVAGVHLDGQELVPADVVVLAVGSVPATDWLAGSGLDLTDGVGCDAFCAAAPGVFAAGDVARWWHPRYGRTMRVEHRMNASEQGTVVARNVLASLGVIDAPPTAYAPVPYFWSDQYGWRMQAYGVTAGADRVEVLRADPGTPDRPPKMLALYGDRDLARGAVSIGLRPAGTRALRAVAAGPTDWGRALDAARTASNGNW
ncbi:NAD(P)/FAD-dependent oxidoreductase [Streptomyces sp. NPDC056452]|uniref:NAD(P)/FAD-dependent oxidoreductase n=1 Tax=Streptomyces sp. NPDC056452 TaxID=3345821 RepID=UPI003689A8DD